MLERVAVTGVGMVSALGRDASATFDALVRGERGFRRLTTFDPGDARARIAAEVAWLDVNAVAPAGAAGGFSRTDALALLAAREALANAGGAAGRLGICLGGTTGGMFETEQALLAGPLDRIEPERAARLLSHPLDLTAARVGRALGGAVRSATLCAACSSSALAIVEGAGWLFEDGVDRVLAGGADGLCRLTFFGFEVLGALDPEPCRPFDVARRGLGLGEGAAFLCLERESVARARGASILAFLSGAATGAEAHHITHPEPSGAKAAGLITRALAAAGLAPSTIDYVNAHGTGTEQNDAMEAKAFRLAFGPELSRVRVSSIKGQIGHTLGAAGALEAAVTVLSLAHGVLPPTAGLVTPADPDLRHVMGSAEALAARAALSCSFGFGGTGAVLAFEHAASSPKARAPLAKAPASVVVTGLSASGAFGDAQGGDAAAAVLSASPAGDGALERDPVAALDPTRSRRFDRAAALLTGLTERALADAGRGGDDTGLAAGTAFGAVERSVRFVLRAAERGVRRANPAEFPHLVASAASGNASIYAGLTGPVFGITGGTASAERALEAGVTAVRLAQASAVVTGAVEGFDAIVASVLGPALTASGSVPRTEGGALLVLELEQAARARGARPLARFLGTWSVAAQQTWPCAAPRRTARALVLSAALTREHVAALEASAWAGCARSSIVRASGFHEALSAVALAVAASAVAARQADEVLVLNGASDTLSITHFGAVEPGA
nr:hypothetical protein Hi04_10k_c3120_00021 [uncultured bacterium]